MYGSAGTPVPRWDHTQYRTSDLDVRQWTWDELCSDGQTKPDASVWQHLLELRGTALWIWHGAKSSSRKEVQDRFRAAWSEELLCPGDIPAPLHRTSVQEAMRKAWSGQTISGYLGGEGASHEATHLHWRGQIMHTTWLGSFYRDGCMTSGYMLAKMRAWMEMGAKVPQRRMASGKLAFPYMQQTMKTYEADDSYSLWPYYYRCLNVARCKQRKLRIRMHVGFCVLYLGLCTRGLRLTVDRIGAPCVRMGRTCSQCCHTSRLRSAAQQKTDSFVQCLFLQPLFSSCVWHLMQLAYHAAVFFLCVASVPPEDGSDGGTASYVGSPPRISWQRRTSSAFWQSARSVRMP